VRSEVCEDERDRGIDGTGETDYGADAAVTCSEDGLVIWVGLWHPLFSVKVSV
jgi:hypothetical protein